MEVFVISTLLFIFLTCIAVMVLVVQFIKINLQLNSLKKYILYAKDKINSARYGNFRIKLEAKRDLFGLYKSLNDLFESVCDRDLVINEYREKEKENSNLREEFIAALTHDLKVPIIAQDKTFDLLLQEKFGALLDVQRDVILKLKKSTTDLKEMVNSMLEAHKIETSGVRLDIAHEINAGEFLTQCIGEVENLVNSTGKKIKFHNNAPLLKADFDKLLIKRVVNNLIINALNHSKTTDKIDIYLACADKKFSIDVVDYGEGIDGVEILKIFNKYYCAPNETSRYANGLGLYLSNKIVKKHNGIIEAKSKKGEGAVFRIILPVKNN